MMQDDKLQQLPPGDRALENVKWVHQDKIGYIFPENTPIHLSNQVEKGKWSDITDQKNISEEVVSEEVFMLWLDHGHHPENASYAYIVVPDVAVQTLEESSRNNRNIEIIANTGEIQAVKNNTLGICQVAFYQAGEVDISADVKVSMESQGMAMFKMQGNRITQLTVADPSRKLRKVMLTVSGIYDEKGNNFVTYPNPTQHNTFIIVDLPQDVYAGKSVTIEL
jgi:chondroitin AC lyase